MKGELWRRLKPLLVAALDLPPEDRRAFLEAELQDDSEVLGEAVRLLGELEKESVGESGAETIAFGDYELADVIGSGGVGVVYRARHLSLGRDVALKLLNPNAAMNPRVVDRFRREAHSGGRLDHPSIVRVYDVGKERGQWFIASELIDGHDLSKELEFQSEGKHVDRWLLPPQLSRAYLETVVELVQSVAGALEAAHSAGIVHRDVKPQNLLLARSGGVKLADFGLARDESLGSITQDGVVEGTPYYMSPEQVRGMGNVVDERTDVYSLGVVLYELLTLKRPYEGTTSAQVLAEIEERDPPPVRQVNNKVPAALAAVCEKAMSKTLSGRYASAGGLAADLDRFRRGEEVSAKPTGGALRAWRHLRRNRVRYLGGAFLLATVAGTVMVADTLEARQQRAELRTGIQWVTAEDRLSARPESQLFQAQASARRILRDPQSTGADVRLAQDCLNRIDGLAEELKQAGLAKIQVGMGFDPESGERSLMGSEALYFEGLAYLEAASRLRPDDRELQVQAKDETHRPKIWVHGFHGEALQGGSFQRVTLRETLGDGSVGPPVECHPDDPMGTAVVSGTYRVTCYAAGGFAELTRSFYLRGSRHELRPRIVPKELATQGMVLIPAGTAQVGRRSAARPGAPEPWEAVRTVEHEAFWVSTHEVTNGEFAEFVELGGGAIPDLWRKVPAADRPSEWDQMPVYGIPFEEAHAYAAWRGCRLLTDIEWQVAVRGRSGFEYPWGNDRDAAPGPVRFQLPSRPGEQAPWWEAYLAGCRAVGTSTGDVSPFGLFDGLGNVREWIETPLQLSLMGWPELPVTSAVAPGMQRLRGGDWRSPQGVSLAGATHAISYAAAGGIRCAKSDL